MKNLKISLLEEREMNDIRGGGGGLNPPYCNCLCGCPEHPHPHHREGEKQQHPATVWTKSDSISLGKSDGNVVIGTEVNFR